MAFMSVEPLSSRLTGIEFTSGSTVRASITSTGGASSTSVSTSLSSLVTSHPQDSSATNTATSNIAQTDAPTTSETSTSSESPSDGSQKPSKAWIAGPVVGPLALILFLVGVWYWGFRQRRLRAKKDSVDPEPQQKFEKPELHADWIPRPISPNPREMSGWTPGHPFFAEKSANEAPAHELPADEAIPNKDQHTSRELKTRDDVENNSGASK